LCERNRMKEIDLPDIFDDCYSAFEDHAAEVELYYDKGNQCWANEQVSFWKDETLGWRFRESSGHSQYGYDSLREAVTCYLSGQISDGLPPDKSFCANRLISVDYRQKVGSTELSCKVSRRCFLSEYNEERFAQKCNALTDGFAIMMGI